ncbi:hypothetical protein ACSW9O_15775 (plasmid) [Clostridium perfringens]
MNKLGCWFTSLIIIFNLVAGGISIDYILSWWNKDIPMIFDLLIGMIVGEFSVPIAIVGWILKALGIF